MKITKDQLKSWAACREGYEWFLRRFPEGEAEYQDVLNALAEDDRPNDADWLMNHAGPDEQAVIEVEAIADCKYFYAAGRLIIKTSATVARRLRAGTGIKAGEGIEAGEDFGIFAGLRVRLSNWTIYARVVAKAKPNNLISGSWVEPASKSEQEAA